MGVAFLCVWALIKHMGKEVKNMKKLSKTLREAKTGLAVVAFTSGTSTLAAYWCAGCLCPCGSGDDNAKAGSKSNSDNDNGGQHG
jgi:hypothetical protein